MVPFMKIDVDPVARLQGIIKAAGTQNAAAKQLGCSAVYLSDLVHRKREFSSQMLAKLGLRRTVVAVEK